MSVVAFKTLPTTAEGWCARLNADDVSESERAAFTAWLNAAAENRAEYELATLAVAVARGLKSVPELRLAARRSRVAPATRNFTLAAGIGLLMLASGWLAWRYLAAGYRTDIGEQEMVALADGSTVQLNTASAMNVDLNGRARHVTLSRGEAFFNIARDPQRPFIVTAGNSEIRVVGTKFNVLIAAGVARVTVLEGHVKVSAVEPSSPFARRGQPAKPRVLDLLPGQGATIATARPEIEVGSVDTAKLTAWREGRIYFENETLSAVLHEVNRYTPTPFVLADPAKGNLRLSGVFRTGDTDSVAFSLRKAYALATLHEADRILVR